MPWTPRHIASKMVRAMEDYREQVGSRLRLLREDRAMSQEDAAHLVGVAVKTWHNWESGKRSPYENNWRRIGEAFEIDVRLIRGKPPTPLGLDAADSQLDRIEQSVGEIKSELARMFDLLDTRAKEALEQLLEAQAEVTGEPERKPDGSRAASTGETSP